MNDRPAEAGWHTESTTTLLSRPHLELVEEEVRAPSGVVRRWLTVQRKPAVVIAPLTHSGSFVLVREERIPVRATLWSFPAGQIDESGEILETARRELREETGYEVAPTGEIKSLGSFFTSPGLTNECVHFCLARPVERQADIEDEMILEVREFGPADLRQMIATNEIRDSNTLSMCARLAAAGILDLTMSI